MRITSKEMQASVFLDALTCIATYYFIPLPRFKCLPWDYIEQHDLKIYPQPILNNIYHIDILLYLCPRVFHFSHTFFVRIKSFLLKIDLPKTY